MVSQPTSASSSSPPWECELSCSSVSVASVQFDVTPEGFGVREARCHIIYLKPVIGNAPCSEEMTFKTVKKELLSRFE
jgi:hypothetical protein